MKKKWVEDVQKNHFRRILDYLPQKTALGSQTWNDGYFCYCGQIVFENQLCVSCARIPILCSVSQTCFDWQARCFVTFQLLILSFPNEKKFKNVGFWPRASKRQLFGYPRRFPKGHSKFQSGTTSVVSVLISGKLTDGCMHSRPLAVKRSEFVNGSGAQGQHSVTVCSRASSGDRTLIPRCCW